MDGPTLAITLASKSATQLNVLAARAVDLACGGNIKAIGLIAERIEGRAGIRSGETDPASDVAREGVQQAIEDIVTPDRANSTAHDSSGGSATPVVPVVIDTEAAPTRLP